MSKRVQQSPFAKLAENRAGTPSPGRGKARSGASASPSASPARASAEPLSAADSFQLARALETPAHRRLRELLADAVREATAWEEAHTLDGLEYATEAKSAWEQVAAAGRAHAELVAALQTIDGAAARLDGVCARMARHAKKLCAASDAARMLVVEVGARRADAAFRTPMWATWTLERFATALGSLALQYVVSGVHVARAVDVLAGRAGSAPTPDAARAALADYVRLPHLHPSGAGAAPTYAADASGACGVSRAFLAHVCAAEVRGWN